MSALQRTAIGDFTISDAVSPADLSPDNVHGHLTDPIQIVAQLAQYRCSENEQTLLRTGRTLAVVTSQLCLPTEQPTADGTVALVCSNGRQLLAMGEFCSNGQQIQPRAVFVR